MNETVAPALPENPKLSCRVLTCSKQSEEFVVRISHPQSNRALKSICQEKAPRRETGMAK